LIGFVKPGHTICALPKKRFSGFGAIFI